METIIKNLLIWSAPALLALIIIELVYSKWIWKDVKRSKNLFEAFMYVFGPPGWSPNGATLTVKQLQEMYLPN